MHLLRGCSILAGLGSKSSADVAVPETLVCLGQARPTNKKIEGCRVIVLDGHDLSS